MVGGSHVLADRERPGVAGIGGREPYNLISLVIKPRSQLVTFAQILPGGVGWQVEKETGIAGVLNVDVDLAGNERLANDVGRAERGAIHSLYPRRIEQHADHLADHR